MPNPMTPEEVRRLRFKSVFRGFDPASVSAQLNRIAEAMEALIAERDELAATPVPDTIEAEVEAVRRDVGDIIDAAREVAAAMRKRATTDAAAIVRTAEEEAVRIRSDAAASVRDAPKHMADPEELEMPSEPSAVGEGVPETGGEPLLGKPLFPPGAPPGGWGAPSVRVIGMDQPAEDDDSPPDEEAIDTAPSDGEEESDTYVDRAETSGLHPGGSRFFDTESTEEAPAGDVDEVRSDDAAPNDTAEAEAATDVPVDEADGEAVPEEKTPIPRATGEPRWEIGALFARLRGEEPPERPVQPEPEPEAPIEPEIEPEPEPDEDTVYPLPEHTTIADSEVEDAEPVAGLVGDPFEMRERLLLPVTNRCLRGLKRQLADIQNDAVELAADASWEPDREELAEEVRPSLKVLISEAFAAGHTAVQEWTESNVTRPQITDRDPSTRFVAGLVEEIESSISGVTGERGRSSAVSRVLRAWRTDEAERRVRSLAHEAFHRGVLASVVSVEGHQPRWLVAGSGCGLCRKKQDTVPVTSPLPPVHAACECVIGVVTV